MTTNWLEVTVEVPSEWSEAIANFLLERGSPGLQTVEHETTTSVIAYFSAAPPLDALRRLCTDLGWEPVKADAAIRTRAVADEDWAESWKQQFHPQTIGRRWYICPSWESSVPPDRIGIVIDPGMAFGTGQHASTRGCLLLMETVLARGGISTALDLGTGSGILAIALAKHGVPDVWAIDTDAGARSIAAANVERNGVAERVRIAPTLPAAPAQADLLVANLFANALIGLAPRIGALVRHTGTLICAGFLAPDVARLCAAYRALAFQISERYEEQEWVALALRRQAS